MSEKRTFTFRTRPHLDKKQHNILNDCGKLLSKVTRSLFAELCRGKSMNELKRLFIIRYEITARQFNSCRIQLEGIIKSKKALLPTQIALLAQRIENLEKKLKKQKVPFIAHQKKRKIFVLKNRHKQLLEDQKSGAARLCFGSKKLFHQQFLLQENGYKNHREWRDDWRSTRDNEFFLERNDITKRLCLQLLKNLAF